VPGPPSEPDAPFSPGDALIALNASHEISRAFFGRLGAALRLESLATADNTLSTLPPPPSQAALLALCRRLAPAPRLTPASGSDPGPGPSSNSSSNPSSNRGPNRAPQPPPRHNAGAEIARRIRDARALAATQRARCSELGGRILTIFDAGYPPALHCLDQPPLVLYVRGELPERPGIAIVGSRRADAYGLEMAELFARHLAARGLTIVSGFAVGIDQAAHRGALAATGGRTLACLGCGLDVDYPRGRRRLAARIARAGAVVSEFPLGYPPLAHNFPIRNRLIAALSLGTLVVRAAARSGSLITARLAAELGRDVYAIPARLFDPKAEGTHLLIQDGALLALRPEDIVESLPHHVHSALLSKQAVAEGPSGPAGAEAKRLFAALPRGATANCEELARAARLSTQRTLSLLLELELEGWVRRSPGPAFSKAR
jgi:DNA processing protein